jgi:shikimate kinase
MKTALIYIYGPPASGKLTIAEKLSSLSGFPLFHNHMTVNSISSIFAFGTEPYNDVVHRLRLDVFQTAARTGTSLIFTNNSAWSEPNGRARFVAFTDEVKEAVETHQGRVVFVRLSAPRNVLEERLASESRRVHEKLLDVDQFRELLESFDESFLHNDDLSIDTSTMNAETAAQTIFDALQEVRHPSN